MMDVIGIGALNWDKLYKVERLAAGGDEIPIESITEAPGGSGANTICGLARLGMKTGFIGKVGTDREGEMILEDLKKEGIDSSHVILDQEGRSGLIFGIVDEKGERALYVHPGVNDTLHIRDIDIPYLNSARVLHMSSFVGEASFEAQKGLMDRIDGPKISFAPGALYARKGLDGLEAILEKTHVFFVNRDEIGMITGVEDYREGARIVAEKGVDIVAVTLGAEGSFVYSGGKGYLSKADTGTSVVDTTGAGDAFAAGFLHGVLNDDPLIDCAKRGNHVAARCIAFMGARAGLPYE